MKSLILFLEMGLIYICIFKIMVGLGDICIIEIYLIICRIGIEIMVKLNIFMIDIMG